MDSIQSELIAGIAAIIVSIVTARLTAKHTYKKQLKNDNHIISEKEIISMQEKIIEIMRKDLALNK